MKKFIGFIMTIVCAFVCVFYVTACGNKNSIKNKIELNLPDKVHVEYYNGTTIYIKDGNEVYAKATTTYSSDRHEVYMKLDLTNAVIFDQPQYSQGYISARWAFLGGDNYAWQCAEDDTNYSSWNANDHNYTVYSAAEKNLRTGYLDVNVSYNLKNATITQGSNETITVGADEVECIVWEYIYENEDIYSKTKYWFAIDTNICLRESEVFNKTDDINAEENFELKATYYKTGESMTTALSGLTEPRVKYIFDAKYI